MPHYFGYYKNDNRGRHETPTIIASLVLTDFVYLIGLPEGFERIFLSDYDLRSTYHIFDRMALIRRNTYKNRESGQIDSTQEDKSIDESFTP